MRKLLNVTLRHLIGYAAVVLIISIPAYYVIISALWAYELNEHDVVLTDAAAREDSILIILSVTGLTVLFFILLFIGFVLVNRIVSKKLWQPFYDSISRIKKFDLQQNSGIELPVSDILEFEELNSSLRKLIEGNRAAFVQQKEFAENASHELQTPLAVIQSKLDLLVQNRDITRQQFEIIEEIQAALARVSRINKNLLFLAKIENSQYMDQAPINLSEQITELISIFEPFAQSKSIELKTDLQTETVITGNPVLVEIMLNNLFTNAIRHSPEKGVVLVELIGNKLSFSNTGLLSLNTGLLFQRFGKTSDQSPGTGLGLSLIQQVCKRYQWELQYAFTSGFHQFSIRF